MKKDSKNHDHGYELPELNPKKPNEMKIIQYKSHVIPVALILSFTAAFIAVFTVQQYFSFQKGIITLDRFTYCMQTIIESSHKVGKTVDAEKAKEICSELKN